MESSPAQGFKAVTTSDSANLPFGPCRSLWSGTGGTIRVYCTVADVAANTYVDFTNVGAGAILPVSAVRVAATGTTATGIVALY